MNLNKEETGLPEIVGWKVPFTPQAPLGNWQDVKQGNGCEEASVLMVNAQIKGTEIKPEEAALEIDKISDFSLNLLGHFHDISNDDTTLLLKEYFKYEKIIVTGYDETKGEFITNDPGTSRGKGFRYSYDQLFEAITDYPTGYRHNHLRMQLNR